MRTQTPRTRSAAHAGARPTTPPGKLRAEQDKGMSAWSGMIARLLLIAMLMSHATAAQTARTAKAASTKATKTAKASKAAEQPQAPVATTVYRCRQADGQLLYTQHACPTAAADSVLQISDARTREQARHRERMHARDRKLGKKMQRERQAWARQAARRNKQALALTLPALDEAKEKAAKRKSASRSSKQASRKTKSGKPLRPADFTARVPGLKADPQQRQREAASARASPKS